MKPVFVISVLLTFSISLYGQKDTTGSIQLKDIIIHGNRISTPFDESSRNIHIVSSPEIRNLPAQSIPEILSYVPGVDIRQRGPMGVQADIGIRGGSFEQTLILINGIKLTDPQTGHHSLNIPLQINNIDRIEILKGPGARIFGQNAFSGAVNFITRIPENRRIGIRLYGGQNGLLGGTADIALPGKYGQYLSISHDRSDGYRYNTDFNMNNAFYQSNLDLAGGDLGFMTGFSQRKFGANGFYASPDFEDQYEEVQTAIFSISYRKKIKDFLIVPKIYLRRNRDNYFFVRNQPEIYENLHITYVGAAEINTSWQNSLGQTGMGMEFRKETINGDWVRGGEPSRSNLDGFNRNNFGLFAEHQFNFGSFNMTPGIYINYYSDFDWNVFPGVDLGYKISSDLKIYGNIGKSYRIPTFYDMYYQSPVEQGNPDLNPEEAITYEAGLRYLKKAFTVELNWFLQDSDELIDWISVPLTDSTARWEANNITDITRNGIEIVGSVDMENLLQNNFFINSVFASYSFIHSDLLEQDLITRYVLENIKNQIITGIQHKIFRKIKHNFRVRYIDRESMAPYWLLDSRIFWDGRGGNQIFIEVTNLTNTEYTEVMTPMPGRWIRAGLNYNFRF